MSRWRGVRSYKICPQCGDGYDAFKAYDARGRYCSPACLAAARSERAGEPSVEPAVGPAALPLVVNLGSLGAPGRIDLLHEGEGRRLV